MTAIERRNAIYQVLSADTPISATALAGRFGVTRQVVVGDIALLRAEGRSVIATPRGYIIPVPDGFVRTIACVHNAAQTRDELNAMVDCGCTVIDVVVEHPVYGQLTAPLAISSRYDVEQFIEKMASASASPLSALTEGIHLHTLSCPDEAVFNHLRDKLREMGMLFE
ncbi:MAG: transcription repressor NadR [Oscillospiraceae bacterium]|nr:transcription repressor NadR [Oscillospiraceae bacterium]